ncbi:MAG: biotin/lipoyl-binding protein, partial [Sphingomonadales bacterium]|nr:biotin/lipoyl-binding protein [Sphingomonadales bacterium]
MMKRLKPHLKIVAGVGIALFIVVAFIASRPMSVEVAPTSRNVPVQVFGLGTVEARILSKVGFEVGATIIELSADQGDHVKKGDVLARLYSAEQEARLAKARAGMEHANAKVMMANVAVGKAKAVLAQKIQTNRRKQALLSQRTISIEAAEESQLEVDVASADLAVSVRDVDVAKAALLDAKAQYTFEQVLFAHHTLKAPYDAIVVERHME